MILCRCEDDAQQAYRWLQGRAKAVKLTLHPDKTRIVDLRDGAYGLDLLGFSPAPGEVVEVRSAALPALALGPRDCEYSGQGHSDHGSTVATEAARRGLGG